VASSCRLGVHLDTAILWHARISIGLNAWHELSLSKDNILTISKDVGIGMNLDDVNIRMQGMNEPFRQTGACWRRILPEMGMRLSGKNRNSVIAISCGRHFGIFFSLILIDGCGH
jgi:hypothetical protein